MLPLRTRRQTTIAKSATVTGFGLWSGKDICLEFRPAEPNSGIVFVRSDLGPDARVPARVEHRIESPRRTTLSANGVSVEMVEHVMAALAGLRIDNCEIHVDAPEMPGMDGSSLAFVQALKSASIVQQDASRAFLKITEVTRVGDDECWIEARPAMPGVFDLLYRLDFGNDNPIGRESHRLCVDADSFENELASARTFILEHEAQWLQQQGLAQRVTAKDVLVFGPEGVIDNELRFENECVRHKMLDVVGDLALCDYDLHGHFVAYRSGHRLNATLLEVLLAECQIQGDLRASA